MRLADLRSELCSSTVDHCRRCFVGKSTESRQCPPNVFRASSDACKPLVFIFDKPNDNTPYKTSPVVPIAAFDDRAGRDARLGRAPSHERLLVLCRLLGLIAPDAEELVSPMMHITNAVKCDVCCATGQTGRIVVDASQADTCVRGFLFRELELIQPRGIVFFGVNAQKYVLGKTTRLWTIHSTVVGGKGYKTMRVPHTSPEAFNTHGQGGRAYLQPFKNLRAAIGAEG